MVHVCICLECLYPGRPLCIFLSCDSPFSFAGSELFPQVDVQDSRSLVSLPVDALGEILARVESLADVRCLTRSCKAFLACSRSEHVQAAWLMAHCPVSSSCPMEAREEFPRKHLLPTPPLLVLWRWQLALGHHHEDSLLQLKAIKYLRLHAAILASGCQTLRIPTPASLAGTIYILVPACNKAYIALGPAVKQHLVPLLKVPLGILLAGSCSSSSDAACQHLCCCLHLITLKHHIHVCTFQPAAMIFVLMQTHNSSHINPDKTPPQMRTNILRLEHCASRT